MKRRLIAVVAGVLYFVVLVSLLLLQALTIQESITSLVANAVTLLLVIPVFFLFKAYIRLVAAEEAANYRKGTEKEETEKERRQMSLEQLRSLYYVLAERQGLSAREQEVGWLIYRGYSNLQIAEELYISEATVKKHASHIYEKLQISGRKEFREKVNREMTQDKAFCTK